MSIEARTAIHDNDAERLASLLRDGPPEAELKELWWEAVNRGSTPCMTVLLELGAPFDDRDPQSWTALHRMADQGNVEALRLLLSYGADMSATNASNRTALHIAVRGGHEECVRTLLDEGADMWFEDCNGTTPMVYATRFAGILQLLLDQMQNYTEEEVPEEYRQRQMNKSIMNATLIESTDTLQALIAAGADCNAYDGRPLNTALMRGNADVVRILLEGGARPAMCRLTVLRPMFVAVFRGHVECVKLLLQHGGDVNETHINGDTPLLIAASEGQTAMVRYLVDHGADVNHQGGHGQTALHHAVQLGKASMAQLLLSAGASPNIAGEADYTPIHSLLARTSALTPGHHECLRHLLQFEADVDRPCDPIQPGIAYTPLMLSWWNQHLRPMQLLLSVGCTLPPHNPAELVAARRRSLPTPTSTAASTSSPFSTTTNEELIEQLKQTRIVPELQALCRRSIRTIFSGRLSDLYSLALPMPIKEYLDYFDIDCL